MSEQEQELNKTVVAGATTDATTPENVGEGSIQESSSSAAKEEAVEAESSTLEPSSEKESHAPEDDYSELTLTELLSKLAQIAKEELSEKTRDRISLLQSLFYKKLEAVREQARKEWESIEEHGEEIFEAPFKGEEQQFREYIQAYK
ncbi:MAG: hypothetical protein ACTTKZ_05635, partial [Bacteroides sp.]